MSPKYHCYVFKNIPIISLSFPALESASLFDAQTVQGLYVKFFSEITF